MLKGIYKEFITVKLKGNPIYDEAIFIMKREEKDKERRQSSDLIFEANRILCEQNVKAPRKRLKIFKKMFFSSILLLLGGFSGALITFFILKWTVFLSFIDFF